METVPGDKNFTGHACMYRGDYAQTQTGDTYTHTHTHTNNSRIRVQSVENTTPLRLSNNDHEENTTHSHPFYQDVGVVTTPQNTQDFTHKTMMTTGSGLQCASAHEGVQMCVTTPYECTNTETCV